MRARSPGEIFIPSHHTGNAHGGVPPTAAEHDSLISSVAGLGHKKLQGW